MELGAVIVGVLSGGTFGALVSGYVQHKQDLARQAASGMAAWKLLRFELGDALETVKDVTANHGWPIAQRREWHESWLSLRERIVANPPVEAGLNEVAAACARLPELQQVVNDAEKSGQSLEGPDERFLAEVESALLSACQALGYEPLARDHDGRRSAVTLLRRGESVTM